MRAYTRRNSRLSIRISGCPKSLKISPHRDDNIKVRQSTIPSHPLMPDALEKGSADCEVGFFIFPCTLSSSIDGVRHENHAPQKTDRVLQIAASFRTCFGIHAQTPAPTNKRLTRANGQAGAGTHTGRHAHARAGERPLQPASA